MPSNLSPQFKIKARVVLDEFMFDLGDIGEQMGRVSFYFSDNDCVIEDASIYLGGSDIDILEFITESCKKSLIDIARDHVSLSPDPYSDGDRAYDMWRDSKLEDSLSWPKDFK